MSKYRYFNTHFWDDNYIIGLDPSEKLLFIYCLTNPLTNICGIYEITIRRIAFDTGLDQNIIIKLFERLESDDKIKYANGYIAIKNFIKHQKPNSKIKAGIERELSKVPVEMFDFIESFDILPAENIYTRKRVSKKLRGVIMGRDKKCQICGSVNNLEIDHIIPVCQGGQNTEENLRVLCQTCNGKRNSELRWEDHKWVNKNEPPIKMGGVSHLNRNRNRNRNNNSQNNKKNIDVDLVNEIYLMYPTKCTISNRPLSKSSKDKDKISSILKNGIKPDSLKATINRYVSECSSGKVFMKNFSTFLNNLPDYSHVTEPVKPIIPESRLLNGASPYWEGEDE
jgi:hypothetical protein